MRYIYYSEVKDGKLQGNASKSIAIDLKTFEGKRVEITIQLKKNNRSYQQNRLWWLYIGILSKDLGYSKEEIHDIVKFKFLKREKVNEETGEVFEYLGSTAKLSKVEFSELVDQLIVWSANLGIRLPSPNEQIKLDYE